MVRALMAVIERTCPACGAENRIVTTETRPCWRINCSRCGEALVERRGLHTDLVSETRELETRDEREAG